MADLTSFRAIIELWGTSMGSRIALAAEMPNVSPTQVSKWWQRDFIPPEYWSELLAIERATDAGVTAELLARLAAREVAEGARA
jgi:DNA-binding transcriptional regulator YdaS (Cro superfamily)